MAEPAGDRDRLCPPSQRVPAAARSPLATSEQQAQWGL